MSDTYTNSGAPSGYELQVGDVIVSRTAFGDRRHVVHRVTKQYAFVQFNDVAEGKFPRVFNSDFASLPRKQWNTANYMVEKAAR